MNYKLYTIIFFIPFLKFIDNKNVTIGYTYVLSVNREEAEKYVTDELKKTYPDGDFRNANIIIDDYTDRFYSVEKMVNQYCTTDIEPLKKENCLRRFFKKIFRKPDQNMYLSATKPVCKCCGN
jgi:hypothetical protein